MKIRKIMCGLLACAMLPLVAFSGCSGQNTEQSSQPNESIAQAESSQPSKEPSESSQPKESSVDESSESSSSESSKSTEKITPAVWKVADEDGNYIYMMGSIHAADEAVDNMPDYFENAFEECNALAVEADISTASTDMAQAIEVAKSLMYTDGTTIEDHISADTYKAAVNLLKSYNMYTELYDYYMPIMWTSLIDNIIMSQIGLDANYGVDMVLINRAKEENKKVLEVESVEFQLELMMNFSDELQELMLESYVADGALDEQIESLNDLYDKWKKGKITEEDAIDEVDESMTDEEKALLEEYNKAMLYDRNEGMANKAEKYMQSGNTVMFVVGAAHFQGDKGILKLMEDKGCTVTQLTSSDVSDTSTGENTENENSEENYQVAA